MVDLPASMTAAEIAAELQLPDVHAFYMRRSRMVREHGFPRTLPGVPLRWSRAMVLAWIASGGLSDVEPDAGAHVPGANVTPLAAARQRLEARYAAGARS